MVSGYVHASPMHIVRLLFKENWALFSMYHWYHQGPLLPLLCYIHYTLNDSGVGLSYRLTLWCPTILLLLLSPLSSPFLAWWNRTSPQLVCVSSPTGACSGWYRPFGCVMWLWVLYTLKPHRLFSLTSYPCKVTPVLLCMGKPGKEAISTLDRCLHIARKVLFTWRSWMWASRANCLGYGAWKAVSRTL